jgi:hypothetical protein
LPVRDKFALEQSENFTPGVRSFAITAPQLGAVGADEIKPIVLCRQNNPSLAVTILG